MAYNRKPNYYFDTKNSIGVDEIPLGRVIVVEDFDGYTRKYLKKNNTGLTESTTIEQALTNENIISSDIAGVLITEAPLLTGNINGTTGSNINITIANYSVTASYSHLIVTAGSANISNDIISWTLPVVSGNETHKISLRSTESGETISSTSEFSVNVRDFVIVADETILFENSTITSTEFPITSKVDLTSNTIKSDFIEKEFTIKKSKAVVTSDDTFGDGSLVAKFQLDGDTTDTTTSFDSTLETCTFTSGRFGQSASFNGSQKFETNDISFTGDYSVSVWLKSRTSDAANCNFIGHKTIPSHNRLNFRKDRNEFFISDTTNDLIWTEIGDYFKFTNNEWFNVLVTRNGYDYETFIDGVSIGIRTGSVINEAIYNRFGMINDGSGSVNYTGDMDQIEFYNRALNKSEVRDLFNQQYETYSKDEITIMDNTLVDGDILDIDRVEFDTTSKITDLSDITSSTNPFEDGSLVAKYELDGDATDTTGNYDGIENNVTYGAGEIGSGVVLDGGTACIDLQTNITANTAISISGWFNTTDTLTSVIIGDASSSGSSEAKCGCTLKVSGTSQFTMTRNYGNTMYRYNDMETGITLNDGQFHHFVFTSNLECTDYNLYIDGTEITLTGFDTSGTTQSIGNTFIGSDFGTSSTANFFGTLDHVEVYHKKLSSIEAGYLYTQNIPKYQIDISTAGLSEAPKNVLEYNRAIAESYKVEQDGHEDKWINAAVTMDSKINLLKFSRDDDTFADGSLTHKLKMENNVEDINGSLSIPTGIAYGSGKFGQSAIFNGSTSVIDTSLSLASAFTISLWVNSSDNTSRHILLDKDGAISFYYRVDNDTVEIDTNFEYTFSRINNDYCDGNDNHLVISFDGTNTDVYINGVNIPLTVVGAATPPTRIEKLGNYSTAGYEYNGTIDQVEIYNRGLNYNEVQELYNQTVGMFNTSVKLLEKPIIGDTILVNDGSNNLLKEVVINSYIENNNSYTIDITSLGNTYAPRIVARDTAKVSTSLVDTALADNFEERISSVITADDIGLTVDRDDFEVVTYVSDGTTKEIPLSNINTGVDFLWIKSTNLVENHAIYDSIRGISHHIRSDQTTAESNDTYMTSFNSDGFTLGIANNQTNGNGNSYVAFCASLPDTNIINDSNLILNGDFDINYDNWTAHNCTLSVSGGFLTIVDQSPYTPQAYQNVTTVIGQTYLITFEEASITTEPRYASIYIDDVRSYISKSNGNQSYVFVATSTTTKVGFSTGSSVNKENIIVGNIEMFDLGVSAGTIPSYTKSNEFMSAISYTGNGINGSTIGHGLDKAPELIIEKDRDSGSFNWSVQVPGLLTSNTHQLFLNSTGAENPAGAFDVPTSNIFYPSLISYANVNGNKNIAYAFASVEGVCKVGSYTGTGAAGLQIDCGFEPQWILVKRTDTTGDWFTYNNISGDSRYLKANTTGAEGTADYFDFNSTGFVTNGAGLNPDSSTYIFLAIAKGVDHTPTSITETYTEDGRLGRDFKIKTESLYSEDDISRIQIDLDKVTI